MCPSLRLAPLPAAHAAKPKLRGLIALRARGRGGQGSPPATSTARPALDPGALRHRAQPPSGSSEEEKKKFKGWRRFSQISVYEGTVEVTNSTNPSAGSKTVPAGYKTLVVCGFAPLAPSPLAAAAATTTTAAATTAAATSAVTSTTALAVGGGVAVAGGIAGGVAAGTSSGGGSTTPTRTIASPSE